MHIPSFLRNSCSSLRHLFAIQREERLPALLTLVVSVCLNGLFVAQLQPFLASTTNRGNLWRTLLDHFHISGYDPMTIIMVSRWNIDYNPHRHPLYAFFCWPLHQLNGWLRQLTGTDCALYILATLLVMGAVYGMVFFRRTLRSCIGLSAADSNLLTLLFYSMAYVLLMFFTPDHFAFSMPLLLLTVYLSARCMKEQSLRYGHGLTWVLFTLLAGTTLSNGIKVFLSALFVRGKRFFRPSYLLFSVLMPTIAIWCFARYEYKTFVLPREIVQHRTLALRKQKAAEAQAAQLQKDSLSAGKKAEVKKTRMKEKKYGVPMANSGFLKWTDTTTSRSATIVHNLLGESIQLHRDHLLGDVLRARSVFEHYRHPLQYLPEVILLPLFLAGIWMGRRERLLWMLLSFVAFDLSIHLGLGFGINEIFIMSPHFLFVLPMTIAFLLRDGSSRLQRPLRALILVTSLYLLIYNGSLTISYLMG